MSKMNFKPREVKRPQVEPPFVFMDEQGREVKIPMEQFRGLPDEQKEHLARLQMKGHVEENQKKGTYPPKPGFAVTVVVTCGPAELGKASETHKNCPAKMKLHEDYIMARKTYIARYFIVNGDEQKKIEDYWLEHVPTAKFRLEQENGLTEIHRRSLIENKQGERLVSEKINPNNGYAMNHDSNADLRPFAKPCASCGKNHQQPPTDGPVGANR